MKKKPVKKGYFGKFYRREEYSTLMKKMNPKSVKTGRKGGQYFEWIELPNGHPDTTVLIQKKHLDEAKWCLKLAMETLVELAKTSSEPIAHFAARMQQALKNISVK